MYRIQSNDIIKFLLSLFIYLPTIAFIPLELYLIFIPVIIYYYRNDIKEESKSLFKLKHARRGKVFQIISGIVFLSIINRIAHYNSQLGVKDLYGYFFLLPITFYVANLVIDKDLFKFLIFYTFIETLIAIAEYVSGQTTFFHSLSRFEYISNYRLLYDTRVLGLSDTPSLFAEKIFVAILLIDFQRLKSLPWQIVKVILYIGVILTFSRTVIFCSLFYLPMSILYEVSKFKLDFFRIKSNYYQIAVFFMFYSLCFFNMTEFKKQVSRNGMEEATHTQIADLHEQKKDSNLNVNNFVARPILNNCFLEKDTSVIKHDDIRGIKRNQLFEQKKDSNLSVAKLEVSDILKKNIGITTQHDDIEWIKKATAKIDLSGRSEIWGVFVEYISTHFLFGNGSKKFLIGKHHAHNSILELISSNGIIISLLYFVLIVVSVNRGNFLFVLLILMLSMGQYAIFWGMSYVDIIFYSILLARVNSHKEGLFK